MANYTVTGNDDMSALDLSTIENGVVTTSNGTTLTVIATDGTVYTFTGNFTGESGTTFPTGGSITGWTSSATDGSTVDITGLDLSVKTFDRDVMSDNASGLLQKMFNGTDTFDAQAGTGGDILTGYGGNDTFRFGATFGGTDSVNGGGGSNTVVLNGDYTAGLTIASGALTDVQNMQLIGNHSYNLTMSEGTLSGVRNFVLDSTQMHADQTLNFNGSAETVNFDFKLGDVVQSTVIGGSGNNIFNGAGAGDNTLVGGSGNDTFIFGGGFDGSDSINGGGGNNAVFLSGDYSSGMTFGAASLVNIQHLVLEGDAGADNYNLTLNAANNTSDGKLIITGHNTDGSNILTVNGAAASGELVFNGGSSTDNFTGGSGFDVFNTGSGVETLTSGGLHDQFAFSAVANSTGPAFDTINDFDAKNDHFVLGTQVTGIDPTVTTGSLSAGTFNTDMTADLGASQLNADHAVLFTPNAGTYAGDTFLVIDANGQAGYQAGQDLVVELNGANHMALFGTGNFIEFNFAG